MTKKAQKPQPYIKLGEILESWRKEKYSSAAEMLRVRKLSFAYSTYVEFERGISLPSMAHLLELAQAVEKEPDEAVWIWAEVQMPNARLKALFQNRKAVAPAAPSRAEDVFSFDRQWIFGKTEHDFLVKEPWFFDLCLVLALSFPHEVSYESLGLKTYDQITAFKENYIKPWILLGRIHESETGLKAVDNHLLIPNTPEWAPVRARNFSNAYNNVNLSLTKEAIRDQTAYREIATRCLTPEQLREWISRLRVLDQDFRSDTGVDLPADENNRPHSLLVVLGPRQFTLPDEIRAKCCASNSSTNSTP